MRTSFSRPTNKYFQEVVRDVLDYIIEQSENPHEHISPENPKVRKRTLRQKLNEINKSNAASLTGNTALEMEDGRLPIGHKFTNQLLERCHDPGKYAVLNDLLHSRGCINQALILYLKKRQFLYLIGAPILVKDLLPTLRSDRLISPDILFSSHLLGFILS